ncbi:MAG: hypothetical protein KAS39_02550, partial [Actinomycetia bacterium]|nr:hypothetical protein [Actinomycetes bacterium]
YLVNCGLMLYFQPSSSLGVLEKDLRKSKGFSRMQSPDVSVGVVYFPFSTCSIFILKFSP